MSLLSKLIPGKKLNYPPGTMLELWALFQVFGSL